MIKFNHSLVNAAIVAIASAGVCESCTSELSCVTAKQFDDINRAYIANDSALHAKMRMWIDDYDDVIDDGDYVVAKENYIVHPSNANWKAYVKANARLLRDEGEYLDR